MSFLESFLQLGSSDEGQELDGGDGVSWWIDGGGGWMDDGGGWINDGCDG